MYFRRRDWAGKTGKGSIMKAKKVLIYVSMFIMVACCIFSCSDNKENINEEIKNDKIFIDDTEVTNNDVTEAVEKINKIIRIIDYTDDYTWVEYIEDDKDKYAVVDKHGNVLTNINNGSGFLPITGFMHGVSYVEFSGDVYIIDTTGKIILTSADESQGDLVAYGSDDEHAYFMFQKHVADFSSAHEEYNIYDESGRMIAQVSNDVAYKDVWYCGDQMWGFNDNGKSLLYNHNNEFYFYVDDLSVVELEYLKFSNGYAACECKDLSIINGYTGQIINIDVYNIDEEDDTVFTVGRVKNNKFVYTVYNYYDKYFYEAKDGIVPIKYLMVYDIELGFGGSIDYSFDDGSNLTEHMNVIDYYNNWRYCWCNFCCYI